MIRDLDNLAQHAPFGDTTNTAQFWLELLVRVQILLSSDQWTSRRTLQVKVVLDQVLSSPLPRPPDFDGEVPFFFVGSLRSSGGMWWHCATFCACSDIVALRKKGKLGRGDVCMARRGARLRCECWARHNSPGSSLLITLPQPTFRFSHSVSLPQPARSALQLGSFLCSFGSGSACSLCGEFQTYAQTSSCSLPPPLRSVAFLKLVAPTFCFCSCAVSPLCARVTRQIEWGCDRVV